MANRCKYSLTLAGQLIGTANINLACLYLLACEITPEEDAIYSQALLFQKSRSVLKHHVERLFLCR